MVGAASCDEHDDWTIIVSVPEGNGQTGHSSSPEMVQKMLIAGAGA